MQPHRNISAGTVLHLLDESCPCQKTRLCWSTVGKSGYLHHTALATGTKSSRLGMFFTWCSVFWEMLPSQRAARLWAAFPEHREMVGWSRLHLHVSSRLQYSSVRARPKCSTWRRLRSVFATVVLQVEPLLRRGCLHTHCEASHQPSLLTYRNSPLGISAGLG